MEAIKDALTDFLNNRPQVAQLRPIAEMPETVPEGCNRIYWGSKTGDGSWMLPCPLVGCHDTHFIDIQLPTPDPDAEERRQFEEWVRARGYTKRELQRQTEPGSAYKDKDAEALWLGWKSRAELAKKTTST